MCVCLECFSELNMWSFYFLFFICINSELRYWGCRWYKFNMVNVPCNGGTSNSVFVSYHSPFYSSDNIWVRVELRCQFMVFCCFDNNSLTYLRFTVERD